MKKQLAIAAGLAVLSTGAYASKARMAALGQDGKGSIFLKDDRNMFRNAAEVNTMKNYVVTEWGTANDSASTAAAPHAEGGYVREAGAFVYGLYFGNEEDAQNAAKTGTAIGDFVPQDNAIDLVFGGDMGVQWGARVHYASNSNEAQGTATEAYTADNSAFGLGLGMMMGDIAAWANLGLSDESTGILSTAALTHKGAKWAADTGMNIGLSYGMGAWTFFGEYDKTGYEITQDGQNGSTAGFSNKSETSDMAFGVANVQEVSSTARVHYAVSYSSSTTETTNVASTGATATGAETKTSSLPIQVGFEADANSWLTWRGSVTHNFMATTSTNTKNSTDARNDKSTYSKNQTTVAAGMTLNFGKLKVDGAFSQAANLATGNLRLDDLMAQVGVTYNF